MNYYRRYSGDYLRDTARLSMLEHGAYSLLLDYYYSEEQPLPADLNEIYVMVRAMTPADRKAVDKVLAKYFELLDDGYHNNRADHEIEVSQKARNNGKAGGRPAGDKTGTVTGSITGIETGSGTGQGGGLVHPPTTNHQPPTSSPQPPKKTTRGDDSVEQVATIRGAMAKALRDEGVKITPSHPQLVAWSAQGVSIQVLREAIDLARMNKPKPENIPPAYLAPIVNDLINGKAKGINGHSPGRLDWWATDTGWTAKATELGIVEVDYLRLRARVCKRLGPGAWVDQRNGTLLRLIDEVEA